MQNFTQSPRFQTWLQDLRGTPSSDIAENLYDFTPEGNVRFANLQEYFRRMAELHPKLLLVGEAPGYQGTRRTGVPFASEHIITGGMSEVGFFKSGSSFTRPFNELRVYKEPTSTIMWRTISRYESLPLLWAVYPLHPHLPGNLESNRTPTRAEIVSGKEQLMELTELSGVQTALALGNIAKKTLDELSIPCEKLRHPARGGGPVFSRQLDSFYMTMRQGF